MNLSLKMSLTAVKDILVYGVSYIVALFVTYEKQDIHRIYRLQRPEHMPRRKHVHVYCRQCDEPEEIPASTSESEDSEPVSTKASAAECKQAPTVLKKLAAPAKAVAHFADRTATNLRRNTIDRVKSMEGIPPRVRRRLSFSSIQSAVPAVVGRRRAASDAAPTPGLFPKSGSPSVSSSTSSTSTIASELPHPLVRAFTSDSGRDLFLPLLPQPSEHKHKPTSIGEKVALERRSSIASTKPKLARRISSATCKRSIQTRRPSNHARRAHCMSERLSLGAVVIKLSPKGSFDLIRTSIDEASTEEESNSDSGYISTEGSLSDDSMNSSTESSEERARIPI